MSDQNDYVQVIEKTTFGKEPRTVQYADRMPEGASLSSVAVVATNLYSGATDNTVISDTTATIDGTDASVFVQGGTHGSRYVISFRATLDDGTKFQDDFLLIVEDQQVG